MTLRYVISFLILAMIGLGVAPSFAQTTKIDSLLKVMIDQNRFSGSVLVAKNGKVIYEKISGYADQENKIFNDAQTAFSIASIGKVFTATLIMQLVEQGKVQLDKPIAHYLRGYSLPNADKITVHHLLTHSSGYGNYMSHADYRNLLNQSGLQLEDMMPLISSQPLVFDTPGARFEYSNSGFVLLGKIIEQVTGKKYADVLRDAITKPLNMSHTQYAIDRMKMTGLARGYIRSSPQANWESTAAFFPQPFSDGGLFTTGRDLLAFDAALYGGKLIKKESLEQMNRVYIESNQPGMGGILRYGYGMMTFPLSDKVTAIGHAGGSPGYGAEYRHYVAGDDQYTLIIQANYDRVIRPLFFEIQDMIVKGKI
jgi:CubicO group peptidase (beta-lactamase class C family)